MVVPLAGRREDAAPTAGDDPDQIIPFPKSHYSKLIDDDVLHRWNHRWTRETPTARQSRLFWPQIDKSRSKQLLLCNRSEYGDITRLFTGHNNLNKHKLLLGEPITTTSPNCRFCRLAEESSEHLLCDCPDLSASRLRTLGLPTTDCLTLSLMPLDGVRRLIQLIRRALLDGGLEKI